MIHQNEWPIIHVGLPKTGTSSIQLALQDFKRSLCIRTPNDFPQLDNGRVASLFRDLPRLGKAVISHESLLFSPNTALGYPLESRIELIEEALGGRPFRMVLFLRPQHDWLASMYLFRVLLGEDLDPRYFWQEQKDGRLLHWSELVSRLHKMPGLQEFVVRPYVKGQDAVADFFKVCGLRKPVKRRLTRYSLNPSINAAQAPIARSLYHHQEKVMAKGEIRTLMQSVGQGDGPEKMSPFPEEVQRDIRRVFRDDLGKMLSRDSCLDTKSILSFSEVASKWSNGLYPFPGLSLEDDAIQQELARIISSGKLSGHSHFSGLAPHPGS